MYIYILKTYIYINLSVVQFRFDVRVKGTILHYQVGIVGSSNSNVVCCRPDPYSENRGSNIAYHSLPPHLPIPMYSLENTFLLIFSLLGRGACAQCRCRLQRK